MAREEIPAGVFSRMHRSVFFFTEGLKKDNPLELSWRRGCGTANPGMEGDKYVSQEKFESKHSLQDVLNTWLSYGLMMKSMTGYVIAELRGQDAMSTSGAWNFSWEIASCPRL